MEKIALTAAAAFAFALPMSAFAQGQPEEAGSNNQPAATFSEAEPEGAPSPNQIVENASAEEWVTIPTENLLVMTLAPAMNGSGRQVVIQLMPAPFSQGWVENIRTLARAGWYDGISVNRVQENYVVQWGDPGHDNPESGEVETKPLPEELNVMAEADYTTSIEGLNANSRLGMLVSRGKHYRTGNPLSPPPPPPLDKQWDTYAVDAGFADGWPVGTTLQRMWPVHCYGMVGVGRSYSPDTGSGAELYVVNGHAPRHLDRNIALVGRVISGMEHLNSLPRGSGALGFYTEEEAEKRTPILSIRVANDIPEFPQPTFEYLSTEGESFARYAEARANRRDPFFIVPAGGADICNIPVPVRPVVTD